MTYLVKPVYRAVLDYLACSPYLANPRGEGNKSKVGGPNMWVVMVKEIEALPKAPSIGHGAGTAKGPGSLEY